MCVVCHVDLLLYYICVHAQLECVRELLTKLESSRVEQVGKPCLERCVVTMVLALAVVSQIL